jgi:hypothetical protein
MIAIAAASRQSSRALEGLAWVGLTFGLLAIAVVVAGLPVRTVHAAAFGPQDLTAWASAICSAVGAATAALNAIAIAWHRWGRRPRRSRKKTPGGA